jgi:hypothetical protein
MDNTPSSQGLPFEETWQGRWARCGAQTPPELRRYYRLVIPGYADVDDWYQALYNLHRKGKISDRVMSELGGRRLKRMDELEQQYKRRRS